MEQHNIYTQKTLPNFILFHGLCFIHCYIVPYGFTTQSYALEFILSFFFKFCGISNQYSKVRSNLEAAKSYKPDLNINSCKAIFGVDLFSVKELAFKLLLLIFNDIFLNLMQPEQYKREGHPVENYYDKFQHNADSKNAQIKRVKSSDNLPILEKPKKENNKKPFIEPGVTIDHSFEETLTTTCVTDEGIKTYFIAKALTGPMLNFASQQANKKQPAKKPNKKMPTIPTGISGRLDPHLEGYSTITHEGLYRSSNEDKITIYLEENIKWFSIYDGHGGSKCSQFMKEHLHEYFFALDWRKDTPTALRKAFLQAETDWKKKGDNSGSCALVTFIYGNTCYTANLGDSRAILASDKVSKCYQITKDHKPSNPEEQKRVIEAGGKIYQTTAITETAEGLYDSIIGPLRVFPGRLSMTRSFGDCEAKTAKTVNNTASTVIVSEPEITSFQIEDHDVIILGSDGLWDRIENREAVETMKNLYEKGVKNEQWLQKGAQVLLEQAMTRGSTDNVSLIIVGLNDPSLDREPKKGNEHIKIMSSIGNTMQKKKVIKNKENSYPDKMRELDSKISEINKNASRILQQPRRA